MPSSLDPRARFAAACPTIRLAYLAMLAQALLLFAGAISGGRLFGMDRSSWWQILLGVLFAYIVFDSASVVLKGRPMGRWLALVWAGCSALLYAPFLFAAGPGLAPVAVGCTALLLLAALTAVVAVLLPASARVFAGYQDASPLAEIRRRAAEPEPTAPAAKAPQDRQPGSRAREQSAQEKAKQQAVDAAVAKFGPGVADKAAALADKVLADPAAAAKMARAAGVDVDSPAEDGDGEGVSLDEAALNRAQRRALEKARRTGKKATIVQRVQR